MTRVAIIGGGVSGLSAAYYLEQQAPAEAEIALFEQSPRLGGVIRSEREGDFCFEHGPDSFLSQKTIALELVEQLGLTGRLVNSNVRDVYVVRGGRLVPFPAGFQFFVPSRWLPLAVTPLLGWRAKLAVLRELFRQHTPEAQTSDLSVADFVRSRLGAEIYEYLAEPLLSGIYGGDAEQLSTAAVLPQFLALEQKHGNVVRGVLRAARNQAGRRPGRFSMFVSFQHGMQELTDGLAAGLRRTEVRPRQAVEEIVPESNRYRVQGERFDAVVVATPAHAAARLLRPVAPEAAALLADIPYTSAITVSLLYRAEHLPVSAGGFGFVAPRIENRRVLACSWLSAKFEGRAPLGYTYVRGFLGGARRPELVDASDEELAGMVLQELKDLMGVAHPPAAVKVARWPLSMAQPVVGHPQRIAALRERLATHPGLALAGNYLEGIGIPDCIRSAQKAVEKIAPGLL